ncbi:MAG: glycosyltransferase family 4 protein [Candidatus Moranbacteria bacterium]|nr:glycosyltransferase family 4 protein [Candidatus Moranbacteria bacterium]
MKRILLLTRPICPPWDEGSKNFAYTLAKYAGDVEVHLLTYPGCGASDTAWIFNLQNVVCHDIYTSSKWDWSQKIRAYIFLAKEFFLKGGRKYDILHSFFTPTRLNSFALKLCLRNTKTKTIQTLATLRDDLYGAERLKKIIHADFVITYSDYAKEKLEKIGFRKIKRIYPGIDIKKYSPTPKDRAYLKRYETGEDDFVINYTGEYVRLGDMDDIVNAFIDLTRFAIPGLIRDPENKFGAEKLDSRWSLSRTGMRGGNDKNRKFKLHLAVRVKNEKDAQKKREIIAKLKKEGVLDRVAFIDDCSYVMEDVFNLCDISIFPARTMAGKFDIPLAVIEAMACGKPVIASNLERLKYFLNNENSILVPPGNREALKENILYLYNNPEKRNDLARRGIDFVRANFDIAKIVKEYEEVYAKL